MQNKINKIMELLGCEYLSETTQKLVNLTLQKMIESHKIGDDKLYRANEADLWEYIGAVRLDEDTLQDLHDKMLICVEVAIKGKSDKEAMMNENFAKTLQTAKELHEHYFPKKEVDDSYKKQSKVLMEQYYSEEENSKAKKVSKDDFKWEKF